MLKSNPVFAKSSLQSIWQSTRRIPLFMSSHTSTSKPHDVATAVTVDEVEIELFTRVANAWWDPNGLCKGLHKYNKFRIPYILGDWVNHPEILTSGKNKILDVGCGGGLLSEALAKCGVEVTGIDDAEGLIAVAKEHCNANLELKIKPKYYITSIEEHARKHQDYYDKVVACEVIDQITNKDLFVKSCVQALKPGGRIFFSCPSKTRLSLFINIIYGENVMNNPLMGAHHCNKFISSEDLSSILGINGCKVEDIRGVAFNMIENTWQWTDTKQLFYYLRAVKV